MNESLLADYQLLTSGQAYVDVSDRTLIEIHGEDRVKFLNSFCTNDVKKLAPGQTCEAFICNVKGMILGHVNVFCASGSLWLDTVPDQAGRLLLHLERYVIREQVEFIDRTTDFIKRMFVGHDAATKLGIGEILSISNFRPAWKGFVTRIAYASEPTIVLYVPSDEASDKRLAEMHAVADEALEIARIEATFPRFGIDFTSENLPQEVARNEQAISFTKGCYLGQETVARIDALGHVNKELRLIKFDELSSPASGLELMAGDKIVGHVTSSTWSPRYQKPIAFAMLKRGHLTAGTRLESAAGSAMVMDRNQVRSTL